MKLFALFVACAFVHSDGFHTPGGGRAVGSLTSTRKSHTLPIPEAFGKGVRSPLFTRSNTQVAASEAGEANWTEKRLHNTPLFRSAAILTALGLAGFASGSPIAKIPNEVAATVHLLSFATWFGTLMYTTFVLGITMFKNLPRRVFGKLQSKLFPKYFMLGSLTILLQLITLNSLHVATKKSAKALGVAFAMTLLNQFYLEPTSTKIMFDRYEWEDEEGGKETKEYKKLASDFGKFHGISSLTNLFALCGAVAHGFFLASALV